MELLAAQALKFRPEVVAIADEERYTELKQALSATSIKVLTGEEGVNYVAAGPPKARLYWQRSLVSLGLSLPWQQCKKGNGWHWPTKKLW